MATIPRILSAALLLLGSTAAEAARPHGHAHRAARAQRPAEAKTVSPAVARGLVLARAHCAGCHGVTANSSSPNPESPPFDDIANKPGLTAESVATFLTDAHNYPAAMNFRIDPEATGDLAAYLASLRRPDYKPSR